MYDSFSYRPFDGGEVKEYATEGEYYEMKEEERKETEMEQEIRPSKIFTMLKVKQVLAKALDNARDEVQSEMDNLIEKNVDGQYTTGLMDGYVLGVKTFEGVINKLIDDPTSMGALSEFVDAFE